MDKNLKEIINILEKLMSYKTVEGEVEEFEGIFEYIKSLIPNNLYLEEYEFKKHKAIVISNTKEKKLDLVFCTHIDVVPASNYDFSYDGKCIKGRGAFDMKGSVAVCLKLLEEFTVSKKVGLFITSDEEIAGYCAKQLLEIYDVSFAIVPDGGKNLQIVKEEKGQLQLKISIKTKSAHASQPYNGINAIVKLYKVYQKIIKKYPLPKNSNDYKTSVNLSLINGGEAMNSVAEKASMVLDIRHTSSDGKDKIMSFIKKIDETLDVEIIHAGSLFKTDLDNEFIKKYIAISEKVLGKEVEIVSSEATSDAIYFSDKMIPTILTNPVGDYAHAENEFIEAESLLHLYEIWKSMLKEEIKNDE